MVRIEKSVEIKAPPEKVWEMLAFDRMPEWMYWKSVAFISEVRTPEDKYRLGASAHVTEKHAKYDLEITESLENEKIMYSSKGIAGGISHLTLTYTLKPVEGGGLKSHMHVLVGVGGFFAQFADCSGTNFSVLSHP